MNDYKQVLAHQCARAGREMASLVVAPDQLIAAWKRIATLTSAFRKARIRYIEGDVDLAIAQARIAALRAENERLIEVNEKLEVEANEHYRLDGLRQAYVDEIFQLRAEVAELRKDREAMDWWSANASGYWFEKGRNSNGEFWVIYKGRGHSQGGIPFVEAGTLRDATTAAIEAAKGGE